MTTLDGEPNPQAPDGRGRSRLIVFARYPKPGKAKTRLIPALGAEGAAQLQHEMTRFTLARLAPLQMRGTRGTRGVEIEIRYTGADEPAMRALYGSEWRYRRQSMGDLGERLEAAAAGAFAEGCSAVALVGTDCPELSAGIIESAFAFPGSADVVLGPAADGGYYLIALRRHQPELFRGIPWGTAGVFAATRRAADRPGLRVALLPQLRDVDHPEDLEVWRRSQEKLNRG